MNIYCSSCGFENSDENNFCPSCGNKMKGNAVSEINGIPSKIFYKGDGIEVHEEGHNSIVYKNGRPLWGTLGTQ